jgi:hypothetical protein
LARGRAQGVLDRLDGRTLVRLYRRLPRGGPLSARSSYCVGRFLEDVAPLRAHGRRPHGRPQCEPLQRQDNAALRTVDYKGGLDAFLLGAHDEKLSTRALKIKKQVKAKQTAVAA